MKAFTVNLSPAGVTNAATSLGFVAKSARIDNYTSQYVYLPDSLVTVPPITFGVIVSLISRGSVGVASLLNPAANPFSSIASPFALANITFFDTDQVPSPGITLQGVSSSQSSVQKIAFDAQTTGSTVGSTLTNAAFTPTAGDLLVACVALHTGSSVSVSGIAGGGTWVKVGSVFVPGSFARAEVWYAPNTPGGSTTVTVTLSGVVSASCNVAAFKGITTSAPLDVFATGTSDTNATDIATPALSTVNAVDLIVGMISNSHNAAGSDTLNNALCAPNSGWTALTGVDGGAGNQICACAWLSVLATGSYSIDWTLGAQAPSGLVIAGFKSA